MGSALPYLSRFHALLLLFRRFLLIRILLIRFLAMTGISTILQVVELKESVKKATITMPAMKSISTILQVESVRRAVLSSIFPLDGAVEKDTKCFITRDHQILGCMIKEQCMRMRINTLYYGSKREGLVKAWAVIWRSLRTGSKN